MKVLKKDLQEAARLKGETRFTWACNKHGEQEFHTSSGNCLACKREKQNLRRKEERNKNPVLTKRDVCMPAWKKGLKFFMWTCKHHGLTEHRVTSENCVSCERQYRKDNAAYMFARYTLSRIENNKQEAFSGITKDEAEALCGYSQVEFILHIESTFKDGMSWGNRSEWHIDHILPVAWFKEQGITDIKVINALSNLRAEWASDNISKGRNFLEEDLTEEEFLEIIMNEVDDGKDF